MTTKKSLVCPYDGTTVNNFRPTGGVRRHDDFFVALYVFEHSINNQSSRPGTSVNLKNAPIPKMNSENSILFEDETYGGVFEDPVDKSKKPGAKSDPKKLQTSSGKKLNETEDPSSFDDSVNVSKSGSKP